MQTFCNVIFCNYEETSEELVRIFSNMNSWKFLCHACEGNRLSCRWNLPEFKFL
jgi:hypothetical protein